MHQVKGKELSPSQNMSKLWAPSTFKLKWILLWLRGSPVSISTFYKYMSLSVWYTFFWVLAYVHLDFSSYFQINPKFHLQLCDSELCLLQLGQCLSHWQGGERQLGPEFLSYISVLGSTKISMFVKEFIENITKILYLYTVDVIWYCDIHLFHEKNGEIHKIHVRCWHDEDLEWMNGWLEIIGKTSTIANQKSLPYLTLPYLTTSPHTLYPDVVLSRSYQPPAAAPPVEIPAISPVQGKQLMFRWSFWFSMVFPVVSISYHFPLHLSAFENLLQSIEIRSKTSSPPSQLGCDLPIAVCLQHAALLVPVVPQHKKFIHGYHYHAILFNNLQCVLRVTWMTVCTMSLYKKSHASCMSVQ